MIIMHGASIMIFGGIEKLPSDHYDLPFTHQFHPNSHYQHQFIENNLLYCHRNRHYNQNRLL